MSTFELNKFMREAAEYHQQKHVYQAKEWKRADCGKIEVYVGDELYVVAVINRKPIKYKSGLVKNNKAIEKTIIRYLQSEGFIGNEYVYVGMQTIDINLLPGLMSEE
jgi:hypothetical protein